MVTLEEYLQQLDRFLGRAASVGDGWTKRQFSGVSCGLYLELRCTIVIPESGQSAQSGVTHKTGNVVNYTYHVIYNESYSVPQLLFTAAKTDGSLVPLSWLHDSIPATLLKSADHVWETLSQVEHPFLHRPFYALHPCQTAPLISVLRGLKSDWLLSWLSAIGPAVGLVLSPEYGLTKHNIDQEQD